MSLDDERERLMYANVLTFWLAGKCVNNVTGLTPNANLSIQIRTVHTKESKMSGLRYVT